MPSQRVKLVEGGALPIPRSFRERLGIEAGDTLVIELDDGELRVRSLTASVRSAQERVRRANPDARSMVDELIADRRTESKSE